MENTHTLFKFSKLDYILLMTLELHIFTLHLWVCIAILCGHFKLPRAKIQQTKMLVTCQRFELPVQIPVQLLLELEPNLLVQNVIELEFELSRIHYFCFVERAKFL